MPRTLSPPMRGPFLQYKSKCYIMYRETVVEILYMVWYDTQIHWFMVQQLFCGRILHCIHISLFYHMTSWNCLQLQFKGKLQNLTHLLLLNAKACFLLGQLPSLWARLFRRTSSANFAVEPWSCWVIGQVYSCSFSELKVTLYFSSCVQNRWWMTNRLK